MVGGRLGRLQYLPEGGRCAVRAAWTSLSELSGTATLTRTEQRTSGQPRRGVLKWRLRYCESLSVTFTLEASKPPCTFRGWSVRSDSVPWVSDSVRNVQQVSVLEISDPPLRGFAMAPKL